MATHDTDPGDPTPPHGTTVPAELELVAYAQELKASVHQLLKTVAKVALAAQTLPQKRDQVAEINRHAAAINEGLDALLQQPKPAEKPVNAVVPRERRGADAGRFKVLVVDDDEDTLCWMGVALEPYFEVFTARDGAEALIKVKEAHPDVVVSDLYMPQTSGLSLLELVRCDESTSHVPLLVCSGATDVEAKIRAFEAGAFDYLTKPIDPSELVARVRNALSRSQALRRERQLQETDDLTGLANRRALRHFLTASLREAAKSQRALTIAMIDQDCLKQINDLYGHAVGDDAIATVAAALKQSKRGTDCAARVGGDEFCVVMPGTDREGALCFIRRVEEQLQKHPVEAGNGLRIQVGASFGLATYGDLAWEENGDALLKRADLALYETKREKKAVDGRVLKLVS